MKKRISVILLALVMCFAAVGCNNTPSDETGEEYSRGHRYRMHYRSNSRLE